MLMHPAQPDPATPVLVGVGEVTDDHTPALAGRSPYDLIEQAARLALHDSGAGAALAGVIDTVAMVRLFADTAPRFASGMGRSSNPPRSIAQRLGLPGVTQHLYTWSGGNMPQVLVNQFAEGLAAGAHRAVLVCGGEALRTQQGVLRAGLPVSWAEDPGGEPALVGDARRGWTDHEADHGLDAAIAFYPLIENAIRGARRRSVAQHLQAMGALMAPLAAVAAANPLATRRDGLSAERLARVDADNRWIAFPYPRFMNANAYIDQAAALLMTTVATARQLGIAPERWVYLHGCAEGHDHWFVSERPQIHRSPAMHAVARSALAMAGLQLGGLRFIDLYSCFPSALEVACDEIGLAEDDPRGLSLTGGLPFFGGPGNNYVTHAIAHMVRALRAAPGSHGLVTANGNYLTKHAWGVYASRPPPGPWRREPPAVLQAALDALPQVPFTTQPAGRAVIESYTVRHDRHGPVTGIVFGRLVDGGRRFIANTPADAVTLADLQDRDSLGRPGWVQHRDGHNTFVPDAG
jgi:acetyl-CoA C-acetyltransferase